MTLRTHRPIPFASLTLALVMYLAADSAHAQDLTLKRGLNLDIWVEWIAVDDMLPREGFLQPYPDWRRVVGPGWMDQIRAAGFDFVRFPADPAPLLALGPGPAQDAAIEGIRQATVELQAAGLNVIVDLHSVPRPGEVWGTDNIVTNLWPDHVALVGRVAAALHGLDPARTAFEPLNEPTLDCPYEDPATNRWPAMLSQMHAAARAGAPDLPLILSGACWGGVTGLQAIDPATFGDANLWWSFHSYEPFAFTHQGASWTYAPLKHITGLPYPPSALDTETALARAAQAALRMTSSDGKADPGAIASEITRYMALPDDEAAREPMAAAAWADRHGIPRSRIILGEFGAMSEGPEGRYPPEWQIAFLADKRRAAEASGFAWAVWSVSDSVSVPGDGPLSPPLDPAFCKALGLAGCGP